MIRGSRPQVLAAAAALALSLGPAPAPAQDRPWPHLFVMAGRCIRQGDCQRADWLQFLALEHLADLAPPPGERAYR